MATVTVGDVTYDIVAAEERAECVCGEAIEIGDAVVTGDTVLHLYELDRDRSYLSEIGVERTPAADALTCGLSDV